MKKLFTLLLLGVGLFGYSQTIERSEMRYIFTQRGTPTKMFDSDKETWSYLYQSTEYVGVIFWEEMDIDSITIHFQSTNGDCGRYLATSSANMVNKEHPYTWESYESIGGFWSSCSEDSVTFVLDQKSKKGIKLQFEMDAVTRRPPHISEMIIYGSIPLVTSVTRIENTSKEVEIVYDLTGREIPFRVDGERIIIEKSGIVIIRYTDGSTEKRFTNSF
jgi:hypothetical protein